jgi:hypothetical protein
MTYPTGELLVESWGEPMGIFPTSGTRALHARRPVPPYSFSPFHQLRTEPLSRETFVAEKLARYILD